MTDNDNRLPPYGIWRAERREAGESGSIETWKAAKRRQDRAAAEWARYRELMDTQGRTSK